MLSWLMQMTAIGYQVYSLTGSKLHLGYVGLAAFLPQALFALLTGHVADRYDRRSVILICQAILVFGSLALLGIALQPNPSVYWIFGIVFITGAAHAFYGPASQALMPQLVPVHHFPNAVAWNSTIWQAAAILGPAVGGLVYDWFGGAAGVYAVDAACGVAGFGLIAMVRTRTGRMEKRAISWQTLLAGLHFIRQRRVILGAISLDLFAVLLGGATALLPVYAKDILKVGETGFGLLRSSPAVGAAITAVVVAHMPPMRRAGATMLVCVGIFGVATIIFGLSKNFYLSLAALGVMGASDMVSVVIRHTLVQLYTPAEMRGRVSAVNLVFVGASNELGEFESGLTAEIFGTVPAVVLGGIGTLLVVGLWSTWFPQLRRVKRLDTVENST